MTGRQRAEDAAAYGVDSADLDAVGPSVVTINGVVASAAMTELMRLITELHEPQPYLEYGGRMGVVTTGIEATSPHCPYCTTWRAAA